MKHSIYRKRRSSWTDSVVWLQIRLPEYSRQHGAF